MAMSRSGLGVGRVLLQQQLVGGKRRLSSALELHNNVFFVKVASFPFSSPISCALPGQRKPLSSMATWMAFLLTSGLLARRRQGSTLWFSNKEMGVQRLGFTVRYQDSNKQYSDQRQGSASTAAVARLRLSQAPTGTSKANSSTRLDDRDWDSTA